jgi:D-galactarolactone cycloisomerase
MEIQSVDPIPVAAGLESGAYGSARGSSDVRETTLIRVETTDGAVGWGEAFAPPRTTSTLVEELLAERVVGSDPRSVGTLCTSSYADPYHFGGSAFLQTAVSGVEIACWDLIGRETGTPIYRLLGGAERTELTPYASTMYYSATERDIKNPIEAAVAEGFDAVKIKIGRDPESDVERTRTARERLGDDGYLMVDFNGNYRPHQAVDVIESLEPFDLTWVEEPVPPENWSGYRTVAKEVSVPIAAGEAHFNRFEFKRLVDEGAVDVLQPNVTRCGGLSEASRIADLATTENVMVRPHVWNAGVGLAAAVQFAATVPTYPHSVSSPYPFLFEYDRGENPLRTDLLADPLDPSDGVLSIPDGPGLGIDVDEAAVERYRMAQ